jgi:hypothetical protein
VEQLLPEDVFQTEDEVGPASKPKFCHKWVKLESFKNFLIVSLA